VDLTPPSLPAVFDPLSPGPALDVDKNPRGWVLQLDHNYRLKVAELIPIREEVCWEASPVK
jgi:hypothetical protein